MAHDGTGTVYIPLEEFWKFVHEYMPDLKGAEVAYGVPRVKDDGGDLEIDYAFSTECAPSDWAKTPDAVKQWTDLKEMKEKKCSENGPKGT